MAESRRQSRSDLNANTDIVITRNGTGTASVVAELDQIEEISINTGGGNDSVLVVGNLTPWICASTPSR